jgi:hypothetical protein
MQTATGLCWGEDMSERKRYYLSFDRNNQRHQEAEALFVSQPARQRTEYIVTSILARNQAVCLEQTVRQAIREELKAVRLSEQEKQTEQKGNGNSLSELPDSLLHALEEL